MNFHLAIAPLFTEPTPSPSPATSRPRSPYTRESPLMPSALPENLSYQANSQHRPSAMRSITDTSSSSASSNGSRRMAIASAMKKMKRTIGDKLEWRSSRVSLFEAEQENLSTDGK